MLIFKKWCWENGVRIYPKAIDTYGTRLLIIKETNGDEEVSKKEYTKENIYKKMEEMYKHIYKKNNVPT